MGEKHELVLDVVPLLKSMNERLKAYNTESKKEDPCTIYRVLPSIRDEDPGAYDPKIISIGPFHQGKEALQPMERLKWRFLNDLIRRSRLNSLENYIKGISSREPQARKHYSPPVTTNRDAFVETMVLDGCFIIEFLIKWYRAELDDQLYAVNWNLPLLRNDLLLLENQLPFFVLQTLFDLSDIQDPVTLKELAIHYVTSGKTDPLSNPNPIHNLLHLFHSTLHPNPVLDGSEANTCIQPAMNATKKVKHVVCCSFLWLLSLFLYCRRPPPRGEKSRAPRRMPSAFQLQEAGVKFKKKKKGRCFLDVGFINGTMEMPRLSIQAATISQFRNLTAFEQCCPTAGNHFTSYVALMDNLIDKPEDVALLEGCGILESKLGDEVEVSHFFNSLGKGSYLDYEKHYLKDLFVDVENYCEAATHRWRAKLMHDYFSNPWSIISLVAATVLLILTALQTFFTVFPYYHPNQPLSSAAPPPGAASPPMFP